MEYVLLVLIIILINLFIILYICYKKTFYYKEPKFKNDDEVLPSDVGYDEYRESVKQDILEARKMSHQLYQIKSFDNLTLYAKYYEYKKGAPIEIMVHGYKSSGERDLSTGIKRAFKCGHNAFIVDQRASGLSEGHIISFGINERKDCFKWIEFVKKTFGEDTKIILTGISMGAATVLMTAGMDLPSNVIGVIADCGYNNPSDIIKKVIIDMKMPPALIFPFIKLSARIFGHFNLNEFSPYEAVQKTNIPIIFFHGTNDDYVPCYMSEKLYNACASKKELVTIEGGIHGTSYLKDPDRYIKAVIDFFKE